RIDLRVEQAELRLDILQVANASLVLVNTLGLLRDHLLQRSELTVAFENAIFHDLEELPTSASNPLTLLLYRPAVFLERGRCIAVAADQFDQLLAELLDFTVFVGGIVHRVGEGEGECGVLKLASRAAVRLVVR